MANCTTCGHTCHFAGAETYATHFSNEKPSVVHGCHYRTFSPEKQYLMREIIARKGPYLIAQAESWRDGSIITISLTGKTFRVDYGDVKYTQEPVERLKNMPRICARLVLPQTSGQCIDRNLTGGQHVVYERRVVTEIETIENVAIYMEIGHCVCKTCKCAECDRRGKK